MILIGFSFVLFFGTAERASRSLPGTSACKVADAGHGEWDFFEPNRAVQLSPCTVAKKKKEKRKKKKKKRRRRKKTPNPWTCLAQYVHQGEYGSCCWSCCRFQQSANVFLAFPGLAPIRLRARDKQNRAGKRGSDIILRVQKAVRRARPSQDG